MLKEYISRQTKISL